MEINNEADKLNFSEMNNPDFLTEDHSKYNFGEPESSTITDESGNTHDASFRVQSGKVSYDKQEDGSYISKYRKDDGDIEVRVMSLEVLTNWFYNPTDEYYNNVISIIIEKE